MLDVAFLLELLFWSSRVVILIAALSVAVGVSVFFAAVVANLCERLYRRCTGDHFRQIQKHSRSSPNVVGTKAALDLVSSALIFDLIVLFHWAISEIAACRTNIFASAF